MTQLIGVIGYPIKHSLSPVLQQAALDYYKLDMRYMLWETIDTDLLSRINELRSSEYLGANVTVPYKEKALKLIDNVEASASSIGSINTIVNRNGKLSGYNTDSYGFMQALEKDAGFDAGNKKVLILGAGGVARAVLVSLVQKGANSLFIYNRTQSRAETLREHIKSIIRTNKYRTNIEVLPDNTVKLQETAEICDLIVNCTTMGMKHSEQEGKSPLPEGIIPKNALVYDLVYNPAETPLLISAREAGASTIGGLPMLVYQGAAAFKLWTGREAPVDIMFRAVENVFKE